LRARPHDAPASGSTAVTKEGTSTGSKPCRRTNGTVDSTNLGLLLSRSWGHSHKADPLASRSTSSTCSVNTIVTRCGSLLTCGTTTTCRRIRARYWLVCETALCLVTARGPPTRSKRSKDGLTSARHLEYCWGRQNTESVTTLRGLHSLGRASSPSIRAATEPSLCHRTGETMRLPHKWLAQEGGRHDQRCRLVGAIALDPGFRPRSFSAVLYRRPWSPTDVRSDGTLLLGALVLSDDRSEFQLPHVGFDGSRELAAGECSLRTIKSRTIKRASWDLPRAPAPPGKRLCLLEGGCESRPLLTVLSHLATSSR